MRCRSHSIASYSLEIFRQVLAELLILELLQIGIFLLLANSFKGNDGL
jgi:hypothetical protein